MARVGEQLLQPETGWKNYECDDINIIYVGEGWNLRTDSWYIGNKGMATNGSIGEKYVKFNFIGTKLRIIANTNIVNKAKEVFINIDGKINDSFTECYNDTLGCLVYEKLGLENKEHSVKIYANINDNIFKYFNIDNIHIDSIGILKSYRLYKYLIQDKNNILYTLNGVDLVQAPSQILDENNFINNGFIDTDLITKDLLLNKFESLEEIRLLAYTDDSEKNKCEMIYNCEPFRSIDKLKKNSDICNILFKEV
ncbi:cell adhesion protein [Clostridium sporogenes]|uniref:cell adhesion protein n=1 Tax=Clostridium sporogenes TaxID=1509 RepID=UPI0013D7CED0|nr:cell adhesion protein [Clostridium sporogenes]EJE7233592.1 cell adhesion protein [Clostridium botulinum]NFE81864.1 cell adhesion protein [Clostridium sporogenes]NFG68598.1 cell adhesion protein [Clostridium sporogenes]